MSTQKPEQIYPDPSPDCLEAEAAAIRAKDTVLEIFGEVGDPPSEHEPTLIRRLRNGGYKRLSQRLRTRGFGDLVLKEGQNA